jgi:two-component system nitrate/nitrite response regulator NarL
MSEQKNFLVVDDDEIFLFTANYVLKRSFPDVNIVTSKNGEEALVKLAALTPDALFVDLNMPVMNGWELLEEISLKYPQLSFPIMIVTSSIDPLDKQKAAAHILKPRFVEKPLSEIKISALNL